MTCQTCHMPVIEFGEVQGQMKYTHGPETSRRVEYIEGMDKLIPTIPGIDHIPVL